MEDAARKARAARARKQRIDAEKKRVRRLRRARLSIMYFLRMLLLITVCFLLCIGVFLLCERLSNLYILTTESMSLRAECILRNEVSPDLAEYFTPDVIAGDSALHDGRYARYTISGYSHDLHVKRILVTPWSRTATVIVIDDASVRGSIDADRLSEGESPADYPLPPWDRAKYEIRFTRFDTRWYITELRRTETNPPGEVLLTPDPRMTPRPMATPTPEPSESPLP